MSCTEQTQPTDALAKLRHLYANMLNGGVRDTASAKRIAEGLLSPAIAELEKWGTPAGAVEPVMWAFQDSEGRWRDASHTEHSAGMKPLYPAPQPTQAQAGAVPLTDEQIGAVADGMPGGSGGFLKTWGWYQFARAVERAHGIKGADHA